MDLHQSSLGCSLSDWHTLDGEQYNGTYQTSYNSSNGVVSKLLVTDILPPQRQLCTSSSHIRERRTVTRRIISSLGQVYFESLYETIDEDIVSRVETQRVQGGGKTLGQRICVESRRKESYKFSIRYTSVTQSF